MSRLITKQYSDALRDPGDQPPLELFPENETDLEDVVAANERTMQAIIALTTAVGMLCKSVMTKGGDPNLAPALTRIAAGQEALLNQLKEKKPRHWTFKIVKDNFGDLDYVDAREVNG